MGGTARILGRIYGGEELIRRFMEGPSILVRQHLLGETDTDVVDGIGLIWDRVTPGELDVLHGCMVGPGDVKHSLYPTQDIVQEGIPTSWSSFVHDTFKKISAEVDTGTAVAHSSLEWLQYLGQKYGDLFKKISIVPADTSNSGYLPGAIDYQYGHALCKEAFSYSWHWSRLDDLSIPLPLQNAFP
ncbi:uncharacterized protein ARMOST_04498 [Armillaria ostoyae]|uniref:Uncharacterized protein n=1 Tax=Armillaria ostoyae TaxID=47428 RepID=A0A284QXJ7_ARMOS|nr:uncharacterized protein ARMOST_04498 [Armillaria ostoyae]